MNKEILKDINVLYVEDEDEVREFTTKTINSIVNSVITAKNGIEGLEKFKENKDINLILTDINMPKMGGLEMCEEIRKEDNEIPIVITSAHSDPDFLKKAIDVQVSAYAMKPIDLYHLIESMIKAVEPIFLRKKLKDVNHNLELKVEEAIQQTKSILDAQDNLVILTDIQKPIDANKKFFEFFEVNSIEEFSKKYISLQNILKKDLIFSEKIFDQNQDWISELSSLSEIQRTVRIQNKENETRIFTINIDNYKQKGEHFVVSFTDITELKEKSNLLEYQANHDQLTGLFNRQKFNEIFKKEIKREKRYENSLSLILFDIDDFKNFNDDFGHQVGDKVLKIIAKLSLENIREHDSICRWGGEEFLILLPQTPKDGAVNVAQKIRKALENYEGKDIPRTITASFGVTLFDHQDDEDSFIKRVDDALYKAKDEGKNRVVFI